MIIDTSCYPTNLVDLAWRHDGPPFTGERLIETMNGPFSSTASRAASTRRSSSRRKATPSIRTDGEKSGTESIDAYMAYTVEMVRKYPDRFIGCLSTTRAAAWRTA